MVDTTRTRDELLTIFADNTSAAISPQDMRDLIVSSFAGGWVTLTKSANTSRNTTTTPADDPHLTTSVDANSAYEFDVTIAYDSPAGGGTPDIKLGWTAPSGSGMGWHHVGFNTSDSIVHSGDSGAASTNNWGTSSTVKRLVRIQGMLHVAGSSGTFAVAWSQATSNGNDTIVYAGSQLRYRKVA